LAPRPAHCPSPAPPTTGTPAGNPSASAAVAQTSPMISPGACNVGTRSRLRPVVASSSSDQSPRSMSIRPSGSAHAVVVRHSPVIRWTRNACTSTTRLVRARVSGSFAASHKSLYRAGVVSGGLPVSRWMASEPTSATSRVARTSIQTIAGRTGLPSSSTHAKVSR
jgi:hypothetical protein